MAMLFYIEPDNVFQGSFPGLDYSLEGYNQQELMKPYDEATAADDSNQMADYILSNPSPSPLSSNLGCSNLLSFADAMQVAECGPKLASNEAKNCEEEAGIAPVHFLKLPVFNDKYLQDNHRSLIVPDHLLGGNQEGLKGFSEERPDNGVGECGHEAQMEDNTLMQLRIHGENLEKKPVKEAKNKRKRPRTTKTSEEIESQRMAHIAVERNRRKQMNEHLRILRSLMPNCYVQRSDQASIVGGAIEFVRELEQLLQCLESQKRQRLYGDGQTRTEDPSLTMQQAQAPSIFTKTYNPNDQVKMMEYETGLREETAESKSCLADVEVRLIGFDGLIKISSRWRGHLIKTVAALEHLQLRILRVNITTMEQSVLYSFNVKISGEARFRAEDIADSIQKILSLIHVNSSMS